MITVCSHDVYCENHCTPSASVYEFFCFYKAKMTCQCFFTTQLVEMLMPNHRKGTKHEMIVMMEVSLSQK